MCTLLISRGHGHLISSPFLSSLPGLPEVNADATPTDAHAYTVLHLPTPPYASLQPVIAGDEWVHGTQRLELPAVAMPEPSGTSDTSESTCSHSRSRVGQHDCGLAAGTGTAAIATFAIVTLAGHFVNAR